jgi:hypothetical protein
MIALGRPSEALQHIERGLESSPYSDELNLRKARALFAAGRPAEALSAIDVALSLRPQGKAYVELKARILCALGRRGEAYDLVCDTLRKKRSYRLHIFRARLALTAGAWRGRPGTARDPSLPSVATTALGGRSVDSPRSRL